MDAHKSPLRSRMAGPVSAAGLVSASACALASSEKSGRSPRSVITRRAMARSSLRFCAEGRLMFGQEYQPSRGIMQPSGKEAIMHGELGRRDLLKAALAAAGAPLVSLWPAPAH